MQRRDGHRRGGTGRTAAPVQYEPRLSAIGAYLWHGQFLSRDRTCQAMAELFGYNLRDYRPLHADAITPGGPGHFGVVFMPGNYRRTKADTGRIISALEEKLTEYPGGPVLAPPAEHSRILVVQVRTHAGWRRR